MSSWNRRRDGMRAGVGQPIRCTHFGEPARGWKRPRGPRARRSHGHPRAAAAGCRSSDKQRGINW
ncbi:hypothetical protein C7S13_4868 [Burkholderia cepacia]|nr:hypothetical protein [Burkholderia cepacia]